jgi:ABC-2 type transport system ATP-binding protein
VSELSISVESVSKRFRLYHERPSSLKERLLRMRHHRASDFWALRDISYDVPEGSTVGLVGANGSGKTTLLKIIGGILRPTAGRVTTKGRIAALLELGAGFHPELTGRENVYLNASILGLSRRDTDRRFDDIVQFSELEEFIDNQVKFYSSGMFMRLGFAVAVHVDPGILLIDEVLAVGDEAFQRKCIDRVREFQREGRTIVLVTHAVDRVRQICDRAIMLERGRVRASGDVGQVVQEFRLAMLQQHAGLDRAEVTRDAEIVGVDLLDAGGGPASLITPGDALQVQVEVRINRPVRDPVVVINVHDTGDQFIYGTTTQHHGIRLFDGEGSKQRVTFDLKALPLMEGRYFVSIGVRPADLSQMYDWHDQQYAFDVARSTEEEGRLFIPTEVKAESL